jgi:hypothetical protein
VTSKQLWQIAVGLGILVFLWGALQIFKKGSDTTTAKFALPALTAADIDSIRILRSNDTLVVAKRGPEAWVVNGFAASNTVVNDLLSALKGTSEAELVAQSGSSHKDLGVDSVSGKRLSVIKANKTLVDLVVGGHGPGYEGVYVRRPSEDAVYLIQGSLGNAVDKGLDDWRDHTIAKVDPDSVREITVQRKKGGYVLRHGSAGWQFAGGGAADSGAVRRMLEQYRSLQAGGFPTQAQEDSLSFKQPTRRVTFRGGSDLLADISFDSTANWWWVRKMGDSTVYRLESWRLPQLFPADSTLKAKPAPKQKAQTDTTKGKAGPAKAGVKQP